MDKKFKKSKLDRKEIREFEQKTIDVARVARVMEGGRRFSFRATVVIGNKKGKVGVGVAKARNNVANAVEKAYADAKRNIIEFPLEGRTIPHIIHSKIGASKVILMPAKEGKGLAAGGSVRIVLELAGIKDVSSKILGSSNKINNARAAVKALKALAESFQFIGDKENASIANNEVLAIDNKEPRETGIKKENEAQKNALKADIEESDIKIDSDETVKSENNGAGL